MRIPIIPAIKRLPAHLAQERFLASVNPPMLLEVLGIDERGIAHGALERALPGVRRLHVVVQEAPSLEALAAGLALVALVVVVRRALVRLQVAALAECRPAELALVGALAWKKMILEG